MSDRQPGVYWDELNAWEAEKTNAKVEEREPGDKKDFMPSLPDNVDLDVASDDLVAPLTPAQKAARTRAANKAKAGK